MLITCLQAPSPVALQKYILQILKSEFDTEQDSWWWEGIPKTVRKKVDDRMNESNGKTGIREQNFDLIHYRDIIVTNWDLFKEIFGYSKAGNSKEKQTVWISEIGEMRNTVYHVSRQQYLTPEKLSRLQMYAEWLQTKNQFIESGIEATGSSSDDIGDDQEQST